MAAPLECTLNVQEAALKGCKGIRTACSTSRGTWQSPCIRQREKASTRHATATSSGSSPQACKSHSKWACLKGGNRPARHAEPDRLYRWFPLREYAYIPPLWTVYLAWISDYCLEQEHERSERSAGEHRLGNGYAGAQCTLPTTEALRETVTTSCHHLKGGTTNSSLSIFPDIW